MALFKKKDKAAKAEKKAKPKKAKAKKAKKTKTKKSKSSSPAVALEKPGMNVYTVMLMLALLAMTVACMVLYMELGRFGDYPWWKTR